MSHPPLHGRPAVRRTRAAPLFACLALALGLAAGPAAAQDPTLIIVNEANPVAALSEREVADLFLKKASTFPDGTKAAPVDLTERSEVRGAFSRWIHSKPTTAIKAYWQQMIFSGRGVPPPEKGSADEVLAYVRAQRGGIGYVPQGTPLGAGVKAVNVTRQ